MAAATALAMATGRCATCGGSGSGGADSPTMTATAGCRATPRAIEELLHPALVRSSLVEPAGGSPHVAATEPDDRVRTIEQHLSAYAPTPTAMQSLTNLYRIGLGPSSSHTMGPNRAAIRFRERVGPDVKHFRVTLFGSLALTGKGHQTDAAILRGLGEGADVEIVWDVVKLWPRHSNAMQFEALSDDKQTVLQTYMAYSVGGGAIVDDTSRGGPPNTPSGQVYEIYPLHSMRQILTWAENSGKPLWQFVVECEGPELLTFLATVWDAMKAALDRGLSATGVLPGGLNLRRRANSMYLKARRMQPVFARNLLLFSYALAVSEENAAAGVVVTAPTCGAAGVLPAVLRWTKEMMGCSDEEIIRALALAGLFGNIAKTNASISGAEVGCQGEVGVACAMAAAACAMLMGGTPAQIEHAAEMALEHHLGLSCCPVEGLVQVPCIDRNAHAATRAVDCAEFALAMDGKHMISYDEVVLAMKLTGLDMNTAYKETALGGISITYNLDEKVEADEKDARVRSLEQTVKKLKEAISQHTTPAPSPPLEQGTSPHQSPHSQPRHTPTLSPEQPSC